MKSNIIKLAIVVPMIFGSMNVMAAGPSEHSARGSEHSIHGLTQTSVAAAKVTSGVVAIPLMIAGGVGDVSGQAGESLWDSATKPIGEPMDITKPNRKSTPRVANS